MKTVAHQPPARRADDRRQRVKVEVIANGSYNFGQRAFGPQVVIHK
jgi:hypothetical protein